LQMQTIDPAKYGLKPYFPIPDMKNTQPSAERDESITDLMQSLFSTSLPVESEHGIGRPTNEALCYMPVAELIQLFKAKVVSPVDLLKAQIERIEMLNPRVNAISERHYVEAVEQASYSAQRYLEGNPRPLEGITCAMKDDLMVKGWRSTMGSLLLKEAPPAEDDSPLTTTMRKAGLVIHIQTNVPEFYCNLVTWNKLTGICRNPWNEAYTPGGSSGGAAAALTAGFTTLAIGSDMGGSIRFPAAMTGIYGFKPPYGRVATSLTQYESEGPLARTFEDMNIFQNELAGPNPVMISSLSADLGTTSDNNCVSIDGKFYSAESWTYALTWPWNMLGQYPVINVPIGFTAERIPLGMQIISDTYDDLAAFQLACAWSKIASR
jgi:Asp-tRNA(Asn)/Glu-tRNA(Gln) amidotransferase A subunit family amidase